LLSDADRPAEALVLQALRTRPGTRRVATRIEELRKRANLAPAVIAPAPGASPFPSTGLRSAGRTRPRRHGVVYARATRASIAWSR
jgi:hypothetical protein